MERRSNENGGVNRVAGGLAVAGRRRLVQVSGRVFTLGAVATTPLVAVFVSLLLAPHPAPAASPAPLTGTIEGVVVIPERPARRTADRYPGAGAAARARDEAQVPVAVHLEGVPGSPSSRSGVRMVQRDTAFAPGLLVVPVGTTVDFPNEDPFFHNVFSYSRPKRFDLGRYPRGESKAVAFDQPGYVKVFCEVHEWMRGAVLVVENPHHAQVAADGSFRLADVPPGSWTVVATDFERGTAEARVTVRAGEVARVRLEFRR